MSLAGVPMTSRSIRMTRSLRFVFLMTFAIGKKEGKVGKALTIAGLALGLAGALLILWGSSSILRAGGFLSPTAGLRKRERRGSLFGVVSLAVGFALQLAGTLVLD